MKTKSKQKLQHLEVTGSIIAPPDYNLFIKAKKKRTGDFCCRGIRAQRQFIIPRQRFSFQDVGTLDSK